MKFSLINIIPLILFFFQGCGSSLGEYNVQLSEESIRQINFVVNEITKKISRGMTENEVFASLGKPSHHLNYKGSSGGVEKIYFHAYGQKYDKNTNIKKYFGKRIKSALLSLGFDTKRKLDWAHLQTTTMDRFLDVQSGGKIIIGTPPLDFAEGTHSMKLMDNRPWEVLRGAKEY